MYISSVLLCFGALYFVSEFEFVVLCHAIGGNVSFRTGY